MKNCIYLIVFVIGSFNFVSCSKSDAQEIIPSSEVESSEKVLLSSYTIVHSTSTSGLSSAVNAKLATSSSYKLAGGPFVYFIGGTQYLGQALYK